jgi:hypothetical protein
VSPSVSLLFFMIAYVSMQSTQIYIVFILEGLASVFACGIFFTFYQFLKEVVFFESLFKTDSAHNVPYFESENS